MLFQTHNESMIIISRDGDEMMEQYIVPLASKRLKCSRYIRLRLEKDTTLYVRRLTKHTSQTLFVPLVSPSCPDQLVVLRCFLSEMQSSSCTWFACGLFLLLICLSVTEAQLNFSPGWGKRSDTPQSAFSAIMENASNSARLRGAPELLDVTRTATAMENEIGFGEACGTPSVAALMKIFRIIKSEASRMSRCHDN
ncbi:Adipokinetic hormone/red pigment-concentrating hormone [Trinorchestia longiramus]|nr:Adipokinetic hormone/red pigment-concentrating hormone [Trinorchestia longiramus]